MLFNNILELHYQLTNLRSVIRKLHLGCVYPQPHPLLFPSEM